MMHPIVGGIMMVRVWLKLYIMIIIHQQDITKILIIRGEKGG